MPARHDRPERVRQSPGTPAGPESRLQKGRPPAGGPVTFPLSLARRGPRGVLFGCVLQGAAGGAAEPVGPNQPGRLDAFMEKVLARREVNRKTLEQIHPRRDRAVRDPRAWTDAAVTGRGASSPGTSATACTFAARCASMASASGKRRGCTYEGSWIQSERRDRSARRKGQGEEREGEERERRAVHRRVGVKSHRPGMSAAPSRDSCPKPTSWTSSSSPATTISRDARGARRTGRPQDRVLPDRHVRRRRRKKDAGQRRRRKGQRADANEATRKRSRRARKDEQDIERQMNKTALITLWIDPPNIRSSSTRSTTSGWTSCPAWLVRVDDLRASMTMGQPFPGVWLPRGMNIHAGITLANGSFEAGYERSVHRVPGWRKSRPRSGAQAQAGSNVPRQVHERSRARRIERRFARLRQPRIRHRSFRQPDRPGNRPRDPRPRQRLC